MYFLKCPTIQIVFIVLSVEAVTKRPLDQNKHVASPKHTKLNDDFLTKFRNLNIKQLGKIDSNLVEPFLGHGGTYEAVQPLASKIQTIESDHLEKVDINNLPENIRSVLETRKLLVDELHKTDFLKNKQELETLKHEKDTLNSQLRKHIRVNKWDPEFQKEYKANVKEITRIEKETNEIQQKVISGDPSVELKLAQNKEEVNQLRNKNLYLRVQAETPFKPQEKQERLEKVKQELASLNKVNNKLSKPLRDYNLHVKNAMGVLSIPYDKHRIFPSTGNIGLDNEIRGLKNADVATAKIKMDEYDKAWVSNMNEGINKRYLKNVDDFAIKTADGKIVIGADGKKMYDYQKLWEHNFDSIVDEAHGEKSKPVKGKKSPQATAHQMKTDYMKRLQATYAKKFITKSIYFIKTPEMGYSRLLNLYISEYKIYLKNDFNGYKTGVQQLLEANEQFGWITKRDIEKLKADHRLADIDFSDDSSIAQARKTNQWNEVAELIKLKAENSNNPLVNGKESTVSPMTKKICSSSSRKKRSTSANECIFFTKRHHESNDVNSDSNKKPTLGSEENIRNPKQKSPNINAGGSDLDALYKPKINMPSDLETVSIDSKRLNNYLIQLDDGDINSVRIKQALVDHISHNSEKLAGTPEDILRTKALISLENLDTHSQQKILATSTLGNIGGDVPPKALSKYQKIKASSSKFAARAEKLTSKSGKFSNAYGKIMLAKGVVTALRHGDYVSLGLIGGRIGLEFGLQGVTKIGKHIAKKATTKFMTKLGSEIIGKLATPIGAIADIGINVYSITKSVKTLNDPNASKFDQNDAIADIVADSIDIAVTATAAVLSLVFPPLAPLFAMTAFVINVFSTLVVAFYKAANHVDRVNEQIPLLDFERTTEYWRYIGGKTTSGYIQELIDLKRANNIAVNLTVQFLINNPDYIGKVFPSKTLHDPGATCRLQRKSCGKALLFIPTGCSDWIDLSRCDGVGEYCEGRYRHHKCQTDSGTDFDLLYHEDDEYRCRCGSDPPAWGYDILDNEVDFRKKIDVYLQRAAPDLQVPTGFAYKCKPSSLRNEGKRVSKPHTDREYLCRGAIAVVREQYCRPFNGWDFFNFERMENKRCGKFMLYDLGNGTDHITLDEGEKVDNLFVVQEGNKHFYGNAGDDTFVFVGPCLFITGLFHGKSYKENGNAIVLESNCYRFGRIQVDLVLGTMKFGSKSAIVNLRNIQRVIGRKDETESITAKCDTTLVSGSGGRLANDPDVVVVPYCTSRSFELTVSVEGSTLLDASKFSNGKVYTLLQGRPSFQSYVPRFFGGTLVYKFDESAGRLTTASIDNTTLSGTLGFSSGGIASFKFIGSPASQPEQVCEVSKNNQENQISILISKNKNFSRLLVLNLDQKTIQCSYRLDKESNMDKSIYGYDFIDNVFHLVSGNWAAFGGKLSDQFILSSSQFSGSIDGKAGENSLHISNDFTDVNRLEVNLNSGFIRRRNTISVKNIQKVYGRLGYIEYVTTACNTKSLDLGGTVYDQVDIPALSCIIDLTISVKGKLTIIDSKSNGTLSIQAGYENQDQCSRTATTQPLELSASFFGSGQTTILLNFQMNQVLSASPKWINIDGGHQVSLDGEYPNIYFEEDYNLKSAMILEQENVIAYHELKNIHFEMVSEPKIRKGANPVQNIFRLAEGTNWEVFGGQLNDMFILASNSFGGKINGGLGSNSFHIVDDINGIAEIDLNTVSIQRNMSNITTFTNIGEIYGRMGEPEKVTVACDIQHVEMNGGYAKNPDIITIPKMNCTRKMTVVATGYTELSSLTEKSNIDIYLKSDTTKNLNIKADIVVTSSTIFNVPIQYPAFKLHSYELKIEDNENLRTVKLYLALSDNNFVEIIQKYDVAHYVAHKRNVNVLFVDADFNSNGNILVNDETTEINILHVLQDGGNRQGVEQRKGAIGARNIFRLNGGNWDAFGGTLDDSFILNNDSITGTLHGLGGVNSLILTEYLTAAVVSVNLKDKSLIMDSSKVTVNSIQIVGGRKGKQEKLICNCDTKLVMLDGGASSDAPDEIEIQQSFCRPQLSIVVTEFTTLENSAIAGNFTYHVRTSKQFDIRYNATLITNHAFKFELPLDQVRNISLEESNLKVYFVDSDIEKRFPLNFQNLPTFHVGLGPELVAEVILEENETVQCSIVARSPYSGTIQGIYGAENKMIVDTFSSLQSIIGGDKDDDIFISKVQSVLFINGRGGTNGLHLDNELHLGKRIEVDFIEEKINFVEGSHFTSFVTVIKGIVLFTGRENDFERVVLNCNTKHLRFVDEVVVRKNCGYEVRIQVEVGTRVIFELEDEIDHLSEVDNELVELEEEDDDNDEHSEEMEESENNDDEIDFGNDDESQSNVEMLPELNPSTFYYHFSTVHSFDIEVDNFIMLRQFRHIFYLNFTLSDLRNLQFALNESRIIYSTFEHNELEFSHVVNGVDDTAMFYSQPEFMTAEGFLLRVTRYGEIIAVVANPEENLDLNIIQQDIIPRLSSYSSKLGISFMVETGSDFVYCGNPNEVNLLTNRENLTSHLVGFERTTYEILDLDNNVFIYPQLVNANETAQVLDLRNIIFQIRNKTKCKYVPTISRNGDNLEIKMTNWTDIFRGNVILVNGTLHYSKISILLNSIVMEIIPPRGNADENNRSKRSIDQNESIWKIVPRPITIPKGHSYILAAEDLEDGVEIKTVSSKDDLEEEEHNSFQFSKDENDLIITSINSENIERGTATTFAIFDYYLPQSESDNNLLGSENETGFVFVKTDKVNNIQIKLGKETISVSSNEPIVSEETGEEIAIQFYEDILDSEESKILKVLPEIPRKFKVSWLKKIGRTTEYLYAFWIVILSCTVLMGSVMYRYCRRRTGRKGKYLVNRRQYLNSIQDEKEAVSLQEFSEENAEDYEEPRLINSINLSEDTFM